MSEITLFLVFSFINLILAYSPPRITTPMGVIEGSVQKTYTGRSFFGFEGVPYAAPPVGERRYENPEDPQKWEGILKATVRTLCYQYTEFQKDAEGNYAVIGDEDCLYLNIYTPTLNQSSNLHVIVHIHGGAFMFGSGAEWRPDMILNRDIVLITINYRLGPLGFLSTEDDVLPGNLGLRDQQHALKWIQKHIQYFGGNPDSVTLHGLSAGSASVHFHFLLPGSEGLFHRGIAESGTALDDWVLMEASLEKAKHLASLVGCPTSDSHKLKNCMKTKPARLIVQNVRAFQPFLYDPFSPWAVVVDGRWASNPVVPEHPLLLLLQKKIQDVPLLMSFVTSEGLYPAADFYAKDEYLREIDRHWNKVMPEIMMYNYTIDHSIIDSVSQTIRKEYMGNEPVNKRTFSQLVQAMGDRNFLVDLEKAIKLHSSGVESSVWSYMYNYRGQQSVSEGDSGTNKNLGVSHGDDTILILRNEAMEPPSAPHDIAMSNLLIDMIMSFIDDGAPKISPQWKPMPKDVHEPLNLLKINRYNDLQPLQRKHIGNRLFWDSLPFMENERLLKIKLGF